MASNPKARSAALAAALAAVLSGCAGPTHTTVEPPLFPPSLTVELGDHGGTVTLTYVGATYSLNGRRVVPGAEIRGSNGHTYRLVQSGARWSAVYVPPDPTAVALGSSGDTVLVTLLEDGGFRIGESVLRSGDTVEASTGSRYTLTLAGDLWRAVYAAPDPVVLLLNSGGETVTMTRNEDASHAADGEPFQSGGVWRTLSGNTYRLTLVAGDWRHEFLASVAQPPAFVVVHLGTSGSSVRLERNQDGSYWLGGALFPSGSIRRAANGAEYRLTLADGTWTATYLATIIDVPVEGSSLTLALARLEDLSHWYEGTQVRSGDIVVRDGNEYQLLRSGGQWTARFRAGNEHVYLPNGRFITLVRHEDGSYTWDGRTVRSGSLHTIYGLRYRLTRGASEWTATRVAFGGGTDGGGGGGGGDGDDGGGPTTISVVTDTSAPVMSPITLPDRMVLELLPPIDSLLTTSEARVGLDLGAAWGNWGGTVRLGTRGGRTEGTHLVVEAGAASFFGEVSYPLEDLLGRGVVRAEVTQGDWIIALYESYIATLKANLPLYERDPASFGPGEEPTSYVTLWRHIDNAIGTVASNWPRGLREGFSPYFDHEDATPREQAELLVAHLERRLDALKNPAKIPDVFPRPGYTGPELRIGLDLAKSKLVFGSTADTRFGAYSVCCRVQVRPHALQPRDVVQPHWTGGHFAYSRIGAPAAADIPRSGTATYTGDTVAAVVPPDPLPTASPRWLNPEAGGAILLSPEPALYAGKITVTADFGTRQVIGAVTDLTDEDDAGLTIAGRTVTRIDLPFAQLEDLSDPSSTPGKFSGTGLSTVWRGSSSTKPDGATFEGHLVDGGSQGFGVWATTLLRSGGSAAEIVTGAFGANRTAVTDASVIPSGVVDRTGTRITRTSFSKLANDGTSRHTELSASGGRLRIAIGDVRIGSSTSVTVTMPALGLGDGETVLQDIRHSGEVVGEAGIGHTAATRFGAWAIPRLASPSIPGYHWEAFAYSPLGFADSVQINGLDITAVYVGGTHAVASSVDAGTGQVNGLGAYTGTVRMEVNWDSEITKDDVLVLRLHDFESTEASVPTWVDGLDVSFGRSGYIGPGEIETTMVRSATARSPHNDLLNGVAGRMRAQFAGETDFGPRAAIGVWHLGPLTNGHSIEGSFGVDLAEFQP